MSVCISKKKKKTRRLKQEASCTSLSVWEGNVLLFWRQSPTLPNVLMPQRHCFVIQFRTIKLRDPHASSMSIQRQHQKQELRLLLFLRSRFCLVFMWWRWCQHGASNQTHSACEWGWMLTAKGIGQEGFRVTYSLRTASKRNQEDQRYTHVYTGRQRQTDRQTCTQARTHTHRKKHTVWWR